MPATSKRRRRGQRALAAPIVFTAVFAGACSSATPDAREPEPGAGAGSPTDTSPDPPAEVASADIRRQPDGTCLQFFPTPTEECPRDADCNPGPPTPPKEVECPPELLPPPPEGGGGTVRKLADGSCVYVFPEPKMDCPVGATCNPGPPREPLKVACPDEPNR